MQAQIGDFIRYDGSVSKVINVYKPFGFEVYELENGRFCAENDLTIEDILLESEVYCG